MKEVKEMPKTGQFIEVNEFGGELWSRVHRWDDDELMTYNGDIDDWLDADENVSDVGYRYFVL